MLRTIVSRFEFRVSRSGFEVQSFLPIGSRGKSLSLTKSLEISLLSYIEENPNSEHRTRNSELET